MVFRAVMVVDNIIEGFPAQFDSTGFWYQPQTTDAACSHKRRAKTLWSPMQQTLDLPEAHTSFSAM